MVARRCRVLLAFFLAAGSALTFHSPVRAGDPQNSFTAQQGGPGGRATLRPVRLPQPYDSIATDEQRTKMQAVQVEYRDKLQELRKQIAALDKERNARLMEILTPEQQDQVKRQASEAMAKRQQQRKNRAKPGQTPKPPAADTPLGPTG